MSDKPKKRKTRLKGTATKKPCFDCGKTKDRFKDFKPRWAGCDEHKTERGRRYFQVGCVACAEKVNGNIRQPRCIECDKTRPKKGAAKTAAVEPVVVEAQPEPVVVEAQPEPEPEPEPEPVVVEAQPEPSPESVALPEPAPRPVPTNAADLFRMLEEADSGE